MDRVLCWTLKNHPATCWQVSFLERAKHFKSSLLVLHKRDTPKNKWYKLTQLQNILICRWRKAEPGSSPVVTSLMSSAALWQPSTSRWVQVDRSLAESTLNTWVSTPCFVPVRRPNERSESRSGELFPGPEWTSLTGDEKGLDGWG